MAKSPCPSPASLTKAGRAGHRAPATDHRRRACSGGAGEPCSRRNHSKIPHRTPLRRALSAGESRLSSVRNLLCAQFSQMLFRNQSFPRVCDAGARSGVLSRSGAAGTAHALARVAVDGPVSFPTLGATCRLVPFFRLFYRTGFQKL